MTSILRCDRFDFRIYLLIPLGIFLLCALVNTAVGLLGAESTFVFLPLFLLLACALLGVCAGTSVVLFTFPLAVSFSASRRRALGAAAVYLVSTWAVLAGLSTALTLLDRWYVYTAMPLLFPGLEVVGDPLYELGVSYLAAAAALGILAGFLGGAVVLRFGRKGGWSLWAIYMAAILFREQIAWRVLMEAWAYWLLVLALLLALAVWSLLRWDVKNG